MKAQLAREQRGFFLTDWLYDGICLKNVFRFGLVIGLGLLVVKVTPVYREAFKAAQVLKQVNRTADPMASPAEIREQVRSRLQAIGVKGIDLDQSIAVFGRGGQRSIVLDYAHEARLTQYMRLTFSFNYDESSTWKEILSGEGQSQ